MGRKWMIPLFLISLLIPRFALAEIYSWVDDRGIQHYTTNFQTIPERYRSSVETLTLPKSPAAPPELQSNPSPVGSARIPFTPGSAVRVNARINGAGPITLILDTGADRTLVAPSTLKRLGISTENATRTMIKGVTGTTSADAVWVDSVEVDGARVGPLLIVAHDADLKGTEGLLGRDFLAHFNVTIDPKEHLVTLAPASH